jgi:hypothetical protein
VDRAEPRTVIVCLPADATADWFTTSLALADHLDSPADLAASSRCVTGR